MTTAPREASPPPNWPRSARPLTVALFGWARLSYQATQGSGYNLSASELAAGLAMSGHRVFYLASGRKYNLVPWSYVSPTERWRGVECFDLVNSPNLSPAAYNFANVAREAHAGRETKLVLPWLKRQTVQVVHVHSLEGFPLDLIRAMRDAGFAVVVTPHNYWYACPQVDLMFQERHLCMDYQGGQRCSTCIRKRTPWLHRLKRRFGQAIEGVVGQETTGAARLVAKAMVRRLRAAEPLEPIPNAAGVDPEAACGLHTEPDPANDGLVRITLGPDAADTFRKPVSPTPLDGNEQFLRAPHHLTVLNEYGRRREQGLAALEAASAVIPPSDFVRSVYVRMGLDESRTSVVRLGQPHFDQLHRRARRSPFYNESPWEPHSASRPLRLAYLGVMRPSKGIDVLAEAITLLPVGIRQRCQFHIRAAGYDWPIRKRLACYPEVAFSGGYDILHLLGEAGEYDVGLLPHVWFENSPLVLHEHLHAGKFVISSRLGGAVEWIDPPRNGLLFAGGHADELAACIGRLVSGEVPIPSPREIHEVTRNLSSYPDHVRNVESVYARALSGEPPASAVNAEPEILSASVRSRPAASASGPLAGPSH